MTNRSRNPRDTYPREEGAPGSFDGNVTGQFKLTGILNFVMAGDYDDWNPTGLADISIICLDAAGDVQSITGIVATAGKVLALINTGTGTANLKNEDSASAAANRFGFGVDALDGVSLRATEGVIIWYDSVGERWRRLDRTLSIVDQIAFISDNHPGSNTHTQIDSHISNTSNPHGVTAAQAGAATTGHTHSMATGEAVLASAFTITEAAGNFENTGLSVTLPSAGKYRITANARAALRPNGGAGTTVWWLSVELYNSSDTAVVANSERLAVLTSTNSQLFQTTCPIDKIIEVTASKTIQLWAARNGNGTPAWTTSTIESNSAGRTTLSYEKIE